MHRALSAIIRTAAASCLLGALASANAAPLSPEDRYVAARDAAIDKISKLYDNGKADDALKTEKAVDDLQSNRIDRKAYDKLGDLRQQGEDAYKRCFIQHAPSSRRLSRPPGKPRRCWRRRSGNSAMPPLDVRAHASADDLVARRRRQRLQNKIAKTTPCKDTRLPSLAPELDPIPRQGV